MTARRPTVAIAARAAALGIAVGGRASAGLAALVTSAGPDDPRWLRHRATKIVAGLAAAGEAVGDQLPATPSRLEGGGLGARLVIGTGVSVLLARRHGASTALVSVAGAAGLAGAFAGTHVGARWRSFAAARFGNDHPGAVIEDAVVIALAAAATRIRR